MIVKELIEQLSQCDPELRVMDENDYDFGTVIEYKNITEPNQSHVTLIT